MAWPQVPLSWLFNESIACGTKDLVWPTNVSLDSSKKLSDRIPGYSAELAVLRHAPLIPAGMESFHWNPQEWTGIHRNGTGICRNGTGIHRNGQESAGMAQEWTKMDILEPRA